MKGDKLMRNEDEVVKYYVWKNNDHADDDGFFDFEDALELAREIDADEIEKTIWYSEDGYENREPADKFEIAWRKET